MLSSCNYCAKCVLYFLMLKAGATLLSLSFRQTFPENGSYCNITRRQCFAFFWRPPHILYCMRVILGYSYKGYFGHI